MSVKVPALIDFNHQGQQFKQGDQVELSPVHAAVLAREGKVSIQGGYQTKVVTAEQPEPAKRRRGRPRKDGTEPGSPRTYQRRDLVSEP